MIVKETEWWKDMEPRRKMILQKGRDNDRQFLMELGCMEQYTWHEGRKEADPQHTNPYCMEDRRRSRK